MIMPKLQRAKPISRGMLRFGKCRAICVCHQYNSGERDMTVSPVTRRISYQLFYRNLMSHLLFYNAPRKPTLVSSPNPLPRGEGEFSNSLLCKAPSPLGGLGWGV